MHLSSQRFIVIIFRFLLKLNNEIREERNSTYKERFSSLENLVHIMGSGRSFCAGGYIVSLHDMAKQGNIEGCKEFFWTLYNFMYHVGTYLKPHVAILDGITMGGGAGVSIPETFRVATDKTVTLSLQNQRNKTKILEHFIKPLPNSHVWLTE